MSLMKRALDAARLRLGRLGRKAAGTVIAATANVLPSARGGGKRTFDPIWVGKQRPRNETQLPREYIPKYLRDADWKPRSMPVPDTSLNSLRSGTTLSGERTAKRQRDRKMREGLPRMSGRQWTKLRKLMYRRAKAVQPQTQETAP